MSDEMKNEEAVAISPPNLQTALFTIVGTTPLVQNKFSRKMREQMRQTQELGSKKAKAKKEQPPKDFEAAYQEAIHYSSDGWIGIPCNAFRAGLVRASGMAGFVMTKAKQIIFIESDGIDADDGTPLVRITKGEPFRHEGITIVSNGAPDVRIRPMWNPGWEVDLRVTFDADVITVTDIANLIVRAGIQIGVGEGRPYVKGSSADSVGMGWGTFKLKEDT